MASIPRHFWRSWLKARGLKTVVIINDLQTMRLRWFEQDEAATMRWISAQIA